MVLNYSAFRPAVVMFTKLEADTPTNALCFNSGCTPCSFPDPTQDLPRIRRGDVTAFREICIGRRPGNVILNRLLRDHFRP